MSFSNDSVQLRFKYDEKEFLAATRLYFWHSKEVVARLIVVYVLFAAGFLLLNSLLDFPIPLWIMLILIALVGLGWFHGVVIDLPRARFRGDPKFRDEYNLIFTEAGIEFKTQNLDAKFAWSFYTGVLENDSFYLLVYGKNINSLSILPKRAFQDSKQEAIFRQMLRRHIDSTLKVSEGEQAEYVPRSLEPPDWR